MNVQQCEVNLRPSCPYVRLKSLRGRRRRPRYLCLQQSPSTLAWQLYSYGKAFGFRRKGKRQVLSDFKTLLPLVLRLLYHQRAMERAYRVGTEYSCGDAWDYLPIAVMSGAKHVRRYQRAGAVVTRGGSPSCNLLY